MRPKSNKPSQSPNQRRKSNTKGINLHHQLPRTWLSHSFKG